MKKLCSACGQMERHYAKGMCRKCYMKAYQKAYEKTEKRKAYLKAYRHKIKRESIEELIKRESAGWVTKCKVCGHEDVLSRADTINHVINNHVDEILDLAIEKTAKAKDEEFRKAIDEEIEKYDPCNPPCSVSGAVSIRNALFDLKQKLFGSAEKEDGGTVRSVNLREEKPAKLRLPSETESGLNDAVAEHNKKFKVGDLVIVPNSACPEFFDKPHKIVAIEGNECKIDGDDNPIKLDNVEIFYPSETPVGQEKDEVKE